MLSGTRRPFLIVLMSSVDCHAPDKCLGTGNRQRKLHSHCNTPLQHMNAGYKTTATIWLDILRASSGGTPG